MLITNLNSDFEKVESRTRNSDIDILGKSSNNKLRQIISHSKELDELSRMTSKSQ